MNSLLLRWDQTKKYYEVMEPDFHGEHNMTLLRAHIISGRSKNTYGVFLESFERIKYIRVGSIREDIERTFETSLSDFEKAKGFALELILSEIQNLLK